MSEPDLKVGQLARVLDPNERTDGKGPGPWRYGKVVGFTADPQGNQHPILALLSVPMIGCPQVTSYYFTRIDRERVERVFHTFSDN
jgi:hypothetical protein